MLGKVFVYLKSSKSSLSFWWPILLCLGLTAIPNTSSQASSQTNEEAAMRALVAGVFKAYAAGEINQLAALCHPQAPALKTIRQELTSRSARQANWRLVNLDFKRSIITAPTAWVRVELEAETTAGGQTKPLTDVNQKKLVLRLRQEKGQWLLWEKLPALDDLAARAAATRAEAAGRQLLEADSDLVTIELNRALNVQGQNARQATPPDYQRSITAFRLALEVAQRFGNLERQATTLRQIGIWHASQRQFKEALQSYDQNLQLLKSPANDADIAQTYNLIGLAYKNQNDLAAAQVAYEKAIQISPPGTRDGADARTNLANFLYDQGLVDEALQGYEQARAIFETLQGDNADPNFRQTVFNHALTLRNLGNCWQEKGNYQQALNYYVRSQKLSAEVKRIINGLYLSFGSTFEKLGRPELALEQYQQALAASQTANDNSARVEALSFIGSAYQMLGDQKRSREALQQAIQGSVAGEDDSYAAFALNLLGRSHALAGEHPQAIEYFQQSLAKLTPLNDREGLTESHYNLALSLLAQKNLPQALEHIQTARRLADVISKREWQWRAQFATAQIQQELNQPALAQQALLAAITTIEGIRGNTTGSETQHQAFFENKTAPYHALAELLLAQNQPAQALIYAERAKARALLDVLQSGKLNLAKAMTATEQEQERKINNELVTLNTQLYREQTGDTPDQQRLQSLIAQLDKARLNYEDFRTRLYAAHPELKVQRGEAQPLTLAEAGALLPDARTALLEFVVLPERVQLFVITKSLAGAARLQVFPLAVKREELAAKVAQFRQQLADRDQRFGRLARELYTLLLQPARAVLPPQTRLLIVPDGPLWELPFQALQKTNNQYLWNEHVIAYAPSLTVLREMAKLKPAPHPNQSKPSFFAIGDPALGGAGVERMQRLMGGTFEQLPEARAQVETVRRFYDPARSRVLTGTAATEAVLKAEAGNYDVLHLATHGVLNDRTPLYSHVLLAQTESSAQTGAQTEDGLLEAWELMQMELHAELAVLSACETARGRVGAGEGMIGLTWALFVAGVPTTVVSQWKVRADSTADLMVEFHRQWQTRPAGTWAKAEALRQAALRVQLDTRYHHPFYWAGFVLLGKTQ